MSVIFPKGFKVEQLTKSHSRGMFSSGESAVDAWLKKRARQAQDKRLSVTRVLLDDIGRIAGYYTLAMGLVNFDELPAEDTKKLPSTLLPIISLAWLGIDKGYQGQGMGERLLAQALSDCHTTGQMMPCIAVILDCLNESAKEFYLRYDFQQVSGYPMKLFLPWQTLDKMMSR